MESKRVFLRGSFVLHKFEISQHLPFLKVICLWLPAGSLIGPRKVILKRLLDRYVCYIVCFCLLYFFCQPHVMVLYVFPWLHSCCTFSCVVVYRPMNYMLLGVCFFPVGLRRGFSHEGRLPPQWKLNEVRNILCRLSFRRLVELCPCSREPIFQKAIAMVRLCQVDDT